MTIDVKDSYQRQIKCWRAELWMLGQRLDRARWDDEAVYVSTQVRDMRMRVRKACDELGIPTFDEDTIDTLIRKIVDRIE